MRQRKSLESDRPRLSLPLGYKTWGSYVTSELHLCHLQTGDDYTLPHRTTGEMKETQYIFVSHYL